jgi:tRNA-specific 2-thiouridylase
MSKKTVLLLMSGGVDSSVAGALLQQQGYDLIGVTFKQLDVEPTREMSGGCCSFGDVRDAKQVAASLNIPHYTINTAAEFRQKVINPFIRSYEAGLTPNPCVHCNSFVRYEEALAMADEQGCDYVASGHYARLSVDESGEPHMYRAFYTQKDQSYYLYGVHRDFLKRIRFPLGDKTKAEVREVAKQLGLVTAEKPESQEICFTLGRPYSEFLSQYIESKEGPILDKQGNELGRHQGITNFTIGQRKGIGLSGGPFYVSRIDPKNNAVVVGTVEELAVTEVNATAARWIHKPSEGDRIFAKVRSRHEPQPATVTMIQTSLLRVTFDEPQFGVAPGQALVLSTNDEEILGGGMIQPTKEHGCV